MDPTGEAATIWPGMGDCAQVSCHLFALWGLDDALRQAWDQLVGYFGTLVRLADGRKVAAARLKRKKVRLFRAFRGELHSRHCGSQCLIPRAQK